MSAMNPMLVYGVDDGCGCGDVITNIPPAPDMTRSYTPTSSQPGKAPRKLSHFAEVLYHPTLMCFSHSVDMFYHS